MRLYILLLALFIGCSVRTDHSNEIPKDTVFALDVAGQYDSTTKAKIYLPDSSLYIGLVSAFDETNEYFIPLYFIADDVDEGTYTFLAEQLDSVVVNEHDGDLVRKRLPMEVATQYFNLSGLERLHFYTAYGNYLSDASLIRIERYETLIESQYIAVYKSEKRIREEVAYCVSGSAPIQEPIYDWRIVGDSTLTDKITGLYQMDKKQLYHSKHIQFFPDSTIYSTMASNLDPSLVVASKGNESVVLKKIDEHYSILNPFPVQYQANGRPVFLALVVRNESDAMWNALLIFDGKEYQYGRGGRCAHCNQGEKVNR